MSASLNTLDKTKISAVALGASGTGTAERATLESDAARIELFRAALELGINVFDTAELYGGGYSEKLLGRAFSHCRESVFICSKFNPCNASMTGIARAVEGSLRRLGTDYIDLYQIHWPTPFIDFSQTWSALSRLLDDGKIRHFGVGNCSYQEFLEYQSLSGEQVAAVELPFNIAEPAAIKSFLSWSRNPGKRIFAYSPLRQGRLCRCPKETNLVDIILKRQGISENQLVLAWVLSHPGVIPVFQTSRLEHLKANLEALKVTLEPEEVSMLEKAYTEPPEKIPLSKIKIGKLDSRDGYSSCMEALENRFDWIPSPALLAERIRRGFYPPPLRLVGPDDMQFYCLDSYDFSGEMKKYWAWRLVNEEEANVPAYISRSQRNR
jgi:aryl-alcohol dehydrogenase-like predicted oxidoreductase